MQQALLIDTAADADTDAAAERIQMEEELRIPAHIAIILDGNGRYAQAHGIPRSLGHKAGCENLEQIVEDCARLGVKYLTVYGFSTENWKRSAEEVGALMSLFRFYMKRLHRIATANDVKVRVIGDRSRFEQDLIDGMEALEADTADNKGLVFVVAVNYGGRDEIRRAAVKMAEAVKAGELDPEEITEETISSFLDTAGMPDPDLLIRTGGE